MKKKAALVFDRENIAHMGALIEAALFKAEITANQKVLLQYGKKFLECRNEKSNIQELIQEFKQIKEKLEKTEKEKNIEALKLWLRGSRKRLQDTLNKEEERLLYERITTKLEEANDD